MLDKSTVRIDTNKQVRDLLRRNLDETVGGIRGNDNDVPWANSLSRTTSNHFAYRTWTDQGTHIRTVRWKLSRPFDASSCGGREDCPNLRVGNNGRRGLLMPCMLLLEGTMYCDGGFLQGFSHLECLKLAETDGSCPRKRPANRQRVKQCLSARARTYTNI